MHENASNLDEESGSMPWTIGVARDAADREIVRTLLRPMSDTMTIVGEAEDGEQALTLVRLERPDLVITDLIMPRLDGVALTRRIRQELPETRVILISSHTEDAYRLWASDSGVDAFVSKQVITTSLVPAIRDLIRRRLSGGSDSLPPITGASSSSPAN